MLLYTRKRILEPKFLVYRCEDVACLAEKLSRGSVDLLLLCQSVPDAECVEVIDIVRAASPEVKVLVLEAGDSGSCSLHSDGAMENSDGPSALLQKIHALLGIAGPQDAHPA
jgi:DNA-binding NarL/FixJ family response regulator